VHKHPADKKFIRTHFWRAKIRPAHLMREPLCRHCAKLGKLVQSNGSTDWISCGSSPLLNPPEMTAVCWVNFSALTPAYLAVINRHGGSFPLHYSFYVKSNSKLALYVGAVLNYDGSGSNTLSTGVWYHLAFTNSASALTGYVNGSVDGTVAGGALSTINAVTEIGQDSNTAGRNAAATIADVALYRLALTQPELRSMAFGVRPHRVRPKALIGYWPLGGGGIAEDKGPFKKHGVLNGTTYTVDPPRLWDIPTISPPFTPFVKTPSAATTAPAVFVHHRRMQGMQ
jgi:hypothetical protein